MKNTFFLGILLFFCIQASTQTVIKNPKIGYSTAPNVIVRKIEILDTATVLHFQTYGGGGAKILIPDKTYIQALGENEKLYVTRSEGIDINTWTDFGKNGELSYKLFFQKIGSTTSRIDYGEANEGGSWFLYDIQLKKTTEKSNIPKDIYGNWFSNGNILWVSFFDTVAIYQNKLWTYREVKIKKGEGSIKLRNQDKEIELIIKKEKKEFISVKDNSGISALCGKVWRQKFKKDTLDTSFKLPVFKNDSATYSGYFKDFSSRFMDKTFTVAVDDIIVGKQSSFLVKISDDGYFSTKLPLYYPQVVWVRSKNFNGSVFLEPGKELFQLFDPQTKSDVLLFMGELAEINTDLHILQKVNAFNYDDFKSKILDMKPFDYKKYFLEIQETELKAVESIKELGLIGLKASQVKKFEIDYTYFSYIMRYEMYFESTYREKNNILWSQRNIPIKIDSFPPDYFSFIHPENVNNPLSVLASGYNSFVNSLKYASILRPTSGFSYTPLLIAEELQKEEYAFTEAEKLLYNKMKVEDSINNIPENKVKNERSSKFMNAFINKYSDTLQVLFRESKEPLYLDNMSTYLISKGVKLTDDEMEFISDFKRISPDSAAQSYQKSVEQFMNTHNAMINKLFIQHQKAARTENLEAKLGIKKGFISDIMDAQDICRGIVEELTPLSDNALKTSLQGISTPFIAEYISFCNEQTILKLEANKSKKDFIVNEIPKTGPELLFDSIMKKYKGKVVYVDFWATWCGPCRSSIEIISPLKEELSGENVVFAYITGPSSPEATWKNMIPNIKGEHYRVSNDEWNYLCSRFNISGIPHYALVGKDGRVINPALGHMGNDAIKAELLKYIKE